MMDSNLKRVDSLDINLVDSACRKEFKLDNNRAGGVGEKRLFIRTCDDKNDLDAFFNFDNTVFFFYAVKDLQIYLDEAHDEFFHPTQKYMNDIKKYYAQLKEQTKLLNKVYVPLKFNCMYDDQKRYYLELEGSRSKNNENRIAYSYFNDVCLPRMTKIYFIKIQNTQNGNIYIYMMPVFVSSQERPSKYLPTVNKSNQVSNDKSESKSKDGEAVLRNTRDSQEQRKWKEKIMEKMPFCCITGITCEEILQACHIKPYSVCEENEKYDVYNGIIMTPTYHELYDDGLISFTSDGRLLVSEILTNRTRNKLGLVEGKKYLNLSEKSKSYMKFHRENVFKAILKDVDSYVEEYNKEVE